MTAAIVTIRFTSKQHIGSKILAVAAQSGQFNHCMIFDRGLVYESVCWHGYRSVIPDVAMRGVKLYQDMQIQVPNLEGMDEFDKRQLGKGYDWNGALGLPFHRSGAWQDDNLWWCSEVLFARLGAGGTWLLDPKEQVWVTPNDLHQTEWPKGPLIQL